MNLKKITLFLSLTCLLSSCVNRSIEKVRPQVIKNLAPLPIDFQQRHGMQIDWKIKGDMPAIDPTGKTIAFRGEDALIWSIDLDGNNLQQLSHFGWDTSPNWSPDGQKIVFQSYGKLSPFDSTIFSAKPQQFSIWVMDRDGQNPYRVENISTDSQQYPHWSPDGRSILWSQRDRIWIADANGKNGRPLTLATGYYQMVVGRSSDGKTLYYRGGNSSSPYWQIGLDGKGAKPMNTVDLPSLLPTDGRYRYDCTNGGIVRIDRRGGKVRVPSIPATNCLISADRTKLIAHDTGNRKGGSNTIYIIDLRPRT